jgi:hypothetical protein
MNGSSTLVKISLMKRVVRDEIIKTMVMPKKILILLLLFLGYQSVTAQDLVDCTYLLADAREAYEAGMVELVPELLLECIETDGLSGESRKEAYKLVINSYLFDYRSADADSLMDDFIMDFPEYRVENSDSQEFAFLLNAHLIAVGIDPDQPPADTVNVEAGDTSSLRLISKFFSRGDGVFGNSLGFKVGASCTIPLTIEGYSVGDPAEDDGKFGPLPGTLFGAEVNLVLNYRLELSIGLQYGMTRLSYSATPLTSVSYRYVEAQHYLELPVAVVYKLNPENPDISYYLRGGVLPGYLLYASGKGTRSSDSSLDDVIVKRTDITDSRSPLNLDFLVGGGFRIPLNNAFLYVEASVNYGILSSNREGNRYMNNDLTWVLYHVDSDFRVHQFTICAGICWGLTKQ